MLISNVVATLKQWNNADPAGLKWSWPSDEASFEAPWSDPYRRSQISFRFIAAECFTEDMLLTKPQLEALYEQDKPQWKARQENA
jgi:hypothetical protein